MYVENEKTELQDLGGGVIRRILAYSEKLMTEDMKLLDIFTPMREDFIFWAMGGENRVFDDMDVIPTPELL